MKKFVAGILVGLVLSFALSANAEEIVSMVGKKVDGTAPVLIDGAQLSTQAVLIEGTSYAPVRAIGEAIGKMVDWKEGKIILDKKQSEEVKEPYPLSWIEYKISDLFQRVDAKKSLLEQYPERVKDKEAFQKEIDELEAELKVWETRKAELEANTNK